MQRHMPLRPAKCSMRGSRPKGRERGKTSAQKRERIAVGDACKEAIVFFIPPFN